MATSSVRGNGSPGWCAEGKRQGIKTVFFGPRQHCSITRSGFFIRARRGLKTVGFIGRWESAFQCGQPDEVFAAMPADRLVLGDKDAGRWFPVQEREDALPACFGGRAKPAVMADALQAFGQDVLEETRDEFHSRQSEGVPLPVGAVFVFEGDPAIGITKGDEALIS